jgi:tyrosine decarboxylase/aspartate 1-decarboxylase
MLEHDSLQMLSIALCTLEEGFNSLPALSPPRVDNARMAFVMKEVATRMHDNYPYFHPQYAGQMLKPPHPIARAAYALATWINPNNHSLDGGRASSKMEKESVADIAAMFGWKEHLGHLCAGGTMANLEALWVAGQLQPGKKVLASDQAHFTHTRISSVLGLPFAAVPSDNFGRMDVKALEKALERGESSCVVATLGTTGSGSVDPLPEILRLRDRFKFRLHVDAAYGGYFTLVGNLPPDARASFDLISEADSIVIDPHKHGLQPYGCGCVLFRNPSVGAIYKHDSPYTYFTSSELHLGEISLDCSRAGASAVALWATMRRSRGAENSQPCSKAVATRRFRSTVASRKMPAGLFPSPPRWIFSCGLRAGDRRAKSLRSRSEFSRPPPAMDCTWRSSGFRCDSFPRLPRSSRTRTRCCACAPS